MNYSPEMYLILPAGKIATQLFDGLVTFTNKGELVLDEAESITPNEGCVCLYHQAEEGLAVLQW